MCNEELGEWSESIVIVLIGLCVSFRWEVILWEMFNSFAVFDCRSWSDSFVVFAALFELDKRFSVELRLLRRPELLCIDLFRIKSVECEAVRIPASELFAFECGFDIVVLVEWSAYIEDPFSSQSTSQSVVKLTSQELVELVTTLDELFAVLLIGSTCCWRLHL